MAICVPKDIEATSLFVVPYGTENMRLCAQVFMLIMGLCGLNSEVDMTICGQRIWKPQACVWSHMVQKS
jgi:hypothetical protein